MTIFHIMKYSAYDFIHCQGDAELPDGVFERYLELMQDDPTPFAPTNERASWNVWAANATNILTQALLEHDPDDALSRNQT